MKLIRTLFFTLTSGLLAGVIACSSSKDIDTSGTSGERLLNVAGVIEVSKLQSNAASSGATFSKQAETIALAAEQLAWTPGFMFADRVFDEALKLDPSNVRARLYKALLAPALLTR